MLLKLNSNLFHSKVLAIKHYHSEETVTQRVLHEKAENRNEWDNAEADTGQCQSATSGKHVATFCRTKRFKHFQRITVRKSP